MFVKFNNTEILSIVGAYGKTSIDLETIQLKNIDIAKHHRLLKSLGFKKVKKLERPKTVVDMTIEAAKIAMDDANINPGDIDAFIFITQTPDYIVPASSYTMQQKLCLSDKVLMMDLTQGCSGYVYGLLYASTLIENGVCKNVLLCVGDTSCLIDNINAGNYDHQVANAMIFGDGCAASVLTRKEGVISYYNIESHGIYSNAIISDSLSVKRMRSYPPGQTPKPKGVTIDGVTLANYTLTEVINNTQEIIKKSQVSLDDIGYILCHQGNKALLKAVGIALNSIKKVKFLSENIGNMSSASIPIIISDNIKDLPDLKTKKTLLVGFGVGLSVASCIVDLSKTKISKPIEV